MVIFLTPLVERNSNPKGSIGNVFTVCIHTENHNQASISPFGHHGISVLVEPTLGHLRYSLTDVPPQPNSLADHVLHTNQPSTHTVLYTQFMCKAIFSTMR